MQGDWNTKVHTESVVRMAKRQARRAQKWVTAAAGVVHEEKHEPNFAQRGGMLEMVKLWVNLPKA